jgi:cell division protein FtsW
MLGFAGLKVAQKAKDSYSKILVAGLTSLILVQATINLFAVMGLAPLTGVPLPFVSYGNSSLMATLFAVGLILNVARGGKASAARDTGTGGGLGKLRVVEGGRASASERASARERSRASGARAAKGRGGGGRNGGARRTRNGGRRRASG